MATGKTYTTRPIAALGATAALWLLINALADGVSVILALVTFHSCRGCRQTSGSASSTRYLTRAA